MDEADLLKRILLIIFFISLTAARSERCVTPNGEEAECISIYSCLKLANGNNNIKEDKDAKEYVRRSYCGFDKDPLICCGNEIKSSKLLSYLQHSKFHINFSDQDDDCINCNTGVNLNLASRRRTSKSNEYLPPEGENSTKDCQSSAFLKLIRPRKNNLGNKSRKVRSLERKRKSKHGNEKYCGVQRKKRGHSINKFPWLVSLRYSHHNKTDAVFRCAGALISERYVVTAAQCIIPDPAAELQVHSVQIPQYNRKCTGGSCPNIIEFRIEKVIPHFEFSKQGSSIGLLKLNITTAQAAHLHPVCLARPNMFNNGKLRESLIVFKDENNLKEHHASFKKITMKNRCRELNDEKTSKICGLPYDVHNINSGTPMFSLFKKQWYLEGVLATIEGKLSFIKVSKYIMWILKNTV